MSAEIRAEIARQHLNYSDVARRMGISRQAVSEKLRNDGANFSLNELSAYSKALGIQNSKLMARVEMNAQEN